MYKSASYLNQRLANVKTSYSNELLAQSWLMKSLPSDPGVKNTLTACPKMHAMAKTARQLAIQI